MDKNKLTAMAAGSILFGEGTQGDPLYLILGVAFIVGGVWYALRERKKSKEQRDYEQKELSQRFLKNINRNQGFIVDDEARSEEPAKPVAQAKKVKGNKKKK